MQIQYANIPALLGSPTDFFPGATVDVGGGQVGILKPNGLYLSVQPDGTYEERSAVGGNYERFTFDPTINVLVVQPRTAIFKIPWKEQ